MLTPIPLSPFKCYKYEITTEFPYLISFLSDVCGRAYPVLIKDASLSNNVFIFKCNWNHFRMLDELNLGNHHEIQEGLRYCGEVDDFIMQE